MALPSNDVVDGWGDNSAALRWAHVDDASFQAVAAALGGVTAWEQYALFTTAVFGLALRNAKVSDSALTPLQAASNVLLWRVARTRAGLSAEDPLDIPRASAPGTAPPIAATGGSTGGSGGVPGPVKKKIKLGHYVVQGDETEVGLH